MPTRCGRRSDQSLQALPARGGRFTQQRFGAAALLGGALALVLMRPWSETVAMRR